ncbi:MAG: LacI family transcriptional regulator [Chloroflexi bacterium]|nr:LacI family transcriptional regulator [Chloroflexota bacterium]
MSIRVTQSDVARRAGVSRATVSYVITGRAGGSVQITEETRQRVLAAVAELGYQPHAAARSLRSGRTDTIALLVPDGSNPHWWAIVRGVEAVTRAQGCQLVLSITGQEAERERQSLRALAEQRIDGLILILTYAGRLAGELEALRLQGSPIVTFGHELPGKDLVTQDYGPGTREMMDHLIGLGHTRIGFIHGVARTGLGADRLFAYRRALRAAGLPYEKQLIVQCGPNPDDGACGARRLLDLSPRPTAILGVNDLMAMGALQAAHERGLAVPADLSVAGFDDIDLAEHLTPPLTTLRANGETIGRQVATLLFQRLSDPERPQQRVAIPTELVVRGSTGCGRSPN